MRKFIPILFTAFLIFPLDILGGIWGYDGQRKAFTNFIWEYRLNDFSEEQYAAAVEALFDSFEAMTGKELVPGEKRRVGLKVYSNSGGGIATPTALVKAVIEALERRGFSSKELFILDIDENRLRAGGFLPPISRRLEGPYFDSVPVQFLDSQKYFDPIWYYDSPLPSQKAPRMIDEIEEVTDQYDRSQDNRKSFLPKHLLIDVDFWINLPVGMEHPAMGVAGSLVNATLWNISNRERFFSSSANAPIAIAEIAAIPELMSGWAMTILPMQQYQFIGGPVFNSLYTRSENRLLMSVNPVALDKVLLNQMNVARVEERFRPIPQQLPMLRFAEALGLGTSDLQQMSWIRLP